MTTAGPIPRQRRTWGTATHVRTVREKLSTWDAPRVEKISWVGDDSVFIGLCTALILLPIMAKLFLMGVAEVRPSRFEPQTNRHGSIYDNLLNEAEGADETTEQSDAPVHLGWLDDVD